MSEIVGISLEGDDEDESLEVNKATSAPSVPGIVLEEDEEDVDVRLQQVEPSLPGIKLDDDDLTEIVVKPAGIELDEEDLDTNILPPQGNVERSFSMEDLDNLLLTAEEDDPYATMSFFGEVEEDTGGIKSRSEFTPQSTLENLYSQYLQTMEVIHRLSNPNNLNTKSLSRDLTHNFLDQSTMKVLNPKQQSLLMRLSSVGKSKEEIIRELLKTEGGSLRPKVRLQLDKAVTQVINNYQEIHNRLRVAQSVTAAANGQIITSHLGHIMNDLRVMHDYLNEGKPVTFVEKVYVSANKGIRYVCGNCNSVNSEERDFVGVLVYENAGGPGDYVQVFPSGKVCDHCASLNILTTEEHRDINFIFNDRYADILSKWFAKSREKLSNSINIVSYIPPVGPMTNSLPSIVPSVYEVWEPEEEETQPVGSFGRGKILKFYEDTVKYLSTLKSVTSTVKKLKITDVGKSGAREVQYEAIFPMLDNLAKVYCDMYNEDYVDLKNQARSSLLGYLKDNPLLINSLSPRAEYIDDILIAYENYLDADLEDAVDDFYTDAIPLFGIAVNPGFEGLPYSNPEVRQYYNQEIRAKIEELKKEREEVEKVRKSNLEFLHESTFMLRFSDIKPVVFESYDDVSMILAYPEVREWLERTSILMILNRLSPQVLSYWKGLKVAGIRHASIFNPNAKKTISELVKPVFTDYKALYYPEGGELIGPADFLHEFLSCRPLILSNLSTIYNLKKSLEDMDLYSFYQAVNRLKDMIPHVAQTFVPFKTLLGEYRREAMEFCQNIPEANESDLTDYYMYHYKHLFSSEEIHEACFGLKEKVKKPYELIPLEGEKFVDYIHRLKSSEYNSENCRPSPDRAKFLKIHRYVVPVYSVFEMYSSLTSYGEDYVFRILMNEIMMYGTLYGERFLYRFLGIGAPLETVASQTAPSLPTFSEERLKIEFMLKNMVFPSSEFNNISYGNDTDQGSILDVLREDTQALLHQLRYFPELRRLVSEFYSS